MPEPLHAIPVDVPMDFSFQQVVEAARDIVVVTSADLDDPGPGIVYVNPAFTALTGYQPHEVIGKNPRILQGEGTSEITRRQIRQALERQLPIRVPIKNYDRNGRAYWLDLSIVPLRQADGTVTHFAAIERDVTEMHSQQQHLERLASTDPLTGLSNRRVYFEQLEREWLRVQRYGSPYAVLLLDVDHFKKVNDVHGHPVGDAVLRAMAATLRDSFREQDVVARIGGEEFAALLPETGMGRALDVAERLRRRIAEQTVATPAGALGVTVSIGVSEGSPTDPEGQDALSRADNAVYEAKRQGRNCCVCSLPAPGA